VLTQKNRGAYGSGVNDVTLQLQRPEDAKQIDGWQGNVAVRLIP
jgi:hypothetical protein